VPHSRLGRSAKPGYFSCGTDSRARRSMNNYVAVILAIIAVILVGEFVIQFADWNKEQACVSSGRRNCAGPAVLLNH
jgi:hypothetical protein